MVITLPLRRGVGPQTGMLREPYSPLKGGMERSPSVAGTHWEPWRNNRTQELGIPNYLCSPSVRSRFCQEEGTV